MKKINKAFTLIELLVVIAIIGILSTVVLVNLSGTRQRARDARRKSDLANIRLGLEMVFDVASPPAYPTAGTGNTVPSGIATYMSGNTVPTDPKGVSYPNTTIAGKYCYEKISATEYQVCALLETGADVAARSFCLPNETYAGCDDEGELAPS